MNKSAVLEQINTLQNNLNQLISNLEKSDNISFYIDAIQQTSIDLYSKVSELKNQKSIEKPIEIKVDKPVIETVAEVQEIIPPKETVKHVEAEIEKINSVIETHKAPVIEHKEAELKVKTENTKQQSIENSNNNDEDISVNERFSKSKLPVLNYADKSKENAIKDLAKAVSIGKKFEFINGLFEGNGEAYKQCLSTVQNSTSYDEAIAFLETQVAENNNWDENEKLAAEFFSLVRRRFMQ